MKTIEFVVTLEHIRQKARGKEGRKLFRYIRKINKALARHGIKRRILSKPDLPELYFIYTLLSSKLPEQAVVIKLIEHIVPFVANVWTFTVSSLHRSKKQQIFTLTIHSMCPDIVGTTVVAEPTENGIRLSIHRGDFIKEGRLDDILDEIIGDLISILLLYKAAGRGDQNELC
jgi:hypothetical protein